MALQQNKKWRGYKTKKKITKMVVTVHLFFLLIRQPQLWMLNYHLFVVVSWCQILNSMLDLMKNSRAWLMPPDPIFLGYSC